MVNSRQLAVHVRNLKKSFGKGDAVVHALNGVNFDAREGEVLMIVGPSGCGKTTLLSLIAGTLKADEGEINVFDQSLHQLNQNQMAQFRSQNVGFIFQQFNLIPTLNCVENVSVPLLINRAPYLEAENQAAEMLAKVGLAGREKEKPFNLSGGQQQRVAIARALVHKPKLVICDEPTSALDSETGAKIMELLREVVKAPGRTVLVVTHDSRIFPYADRMTEMLDGKVARVHEVKLNGVPEQFH